VLKKGNIPKDIKPTINATKLMALNTFANLFQNKAAYCSSLFFSEYIAM
jgi:hypothetical protein